MAHYNKGHIYNHLRRHDLVSLSTQHPLLKIDYLSIDIEGMDYSVLMKLNLKKFKIENISFEHLHLSFWQKIKIVTKLINNGYFFSGMGFDIRKSDWMFTKNYKYKKLQTFLLPITPRRVWKRYQFSILK